MREEDLKTGAAPETDDAPQEAPATETPADAQEAEAVEETPAEQEQEDAKKSFFGKKGEKQLEALKAKLEAAEKNAEEMKDTLLRTAAEYDNFRKRSAREQDAAFGNGLSFAVEQLLPILDTLEMAAGAPCSDENYKKGVEMTLGKASAALAALKVEEIEALGKPFDPNFMSAVQQAPAEEGQESGTVVRVYQKGYKLGEKIIRFAAVVVAE